MLRAKKKIQWFDKLQGKRERRPRSQSAFLSVSRSCAISVLVFYSFFCISLLYIFLSLSLYYLHLSPTFQHPISGHNFYLSRILIGSGTPWDPWGMGWDGLGWRKDREGGRSEGGVLFTLQFPCEQGMSKCERKSEWLSERERIKTEKPHSQQAALQT